jgi:hydroxypyruvate isomerase
MNTNTSRRNLIKKIAAGSVAAAVSHPLLALASENMKDIKLKGNINHSVCQWTYGFMPLEELCAEVKKMGMKAVDLLAPKDWPTVEKYGLVCSMCYIAGKVSLTEGWNNTKFHDQLIKDFSETIPLVEKAGYKNLICFSGSRNGMDDATGLKNCADGLRKILPLAEKHNVMIQMELLNSKVDHKDYMCDKTPWGVELCKQLNSPNFRLLYDIYHMQIDEGDVIRTIRDNHQYFGHYHTGGVPGRHEINESQELYYPAIMKAIIETGHKGYVAQEFIPTGKTTEEKIAALKNAVNVCDV